MSAKRKLKMWVDPGIHPITGFSTTEGNHKEAFSEHMRDKRWRETLLERRKKHKKPKMCYPTQMEIQVQSKINFDYGRKL